LINYIIYLELSYHTVSLLGCSLMPHKSSSGFIHGALRRKTQR
jgi:hypothetical protein